MVRSIFSNWFGLVFNSLLGFFLTPILVRKLGMANFGLWALITAVVGYYGLLDFGTRTALFRFIARFKGAGERRELDRTFMSGLAITLAADALIVASSFGLSLILPGFLKLEGQAAYQFQRLLLILGPAVALTLLGRFLGAYLNALGRFDLCNVVAVIGGMFRAALILGALYLGYGILGVGVAELATAIPSLGIEWWMVMRVDSALTLAWPLINMRRIGDLAGFSVYVFVSMAGDYLRLYSGSLIIARALNVALLAPFSIAMRLLEYFKTLMVALGGPVMGVLCELDGQRRREEFSRLFLDSTRLTMSLSCLAGLMFLFDGKPFLNLWLGPDLVPSTYPILIVMALGYVVAQGQHPTMPALMARAKHPPAAFLMLAEGIASVLLSAWCVSRWGLIGVAWGATVPILAARLLVQPWYAARALGISVKDYIFGGVARPLAATAILLAGLSIAGWPAADLSFWNALRIISSQLAFAGLIGYFIVLKTSERQFLWARSKDIVLISYKWARAERATAAGNP